MKRHFGVSRALVVIALVLAVPSLLISAGTTSRSMTMSFFNTFVDEQTGIGCSVVVPQTAGYCGDLTSDLGMNGSTSTYPNAFWSQPNTTEPFSKFADGADCNPATGTCMSVQLNKNLSTLSVDSRGSIDPTTGRPRYIVMTFTPCPVGACPNGPGPVNPFGSLTTNMPGLLSIFLATPFTNMAVCSSSACPEAESGTARFWFDDPNHTANLQWRIDWPFMRVLRVSSNTWYAVASGCDGSQVATLYRLANNHKSTTISRQGSYLMPFFISGVQ